MIKRILVALSGTPYTSSAIHHAIELARAHEASLTGVTLVDAVSLSDLGPVPIGAGAAAHALAEHRLHEVEDRVETVITEFESACRESGIKGEVVRETGDAMEELISLWRYHDLTVVGLRGLFEYGVMRRPDTEIVKVIAKGVRPILAVAAEHRPIHRVLIAYNGSMESSKAMKRFIQMRLWPSVRIKIACFGFEEDEAHAILDPAAEYCQAHGHVPEIEALPGYPKEGLLKHSHHWSADLVVMGSSARSKLMRLVLGDTALEAMRKSDIPLYLAQ